MTKNAKVTLWMAVNCIVLGAAPALAGNVTFHNPGPTSFELHVRNGPVDQDPDRRGTKNTTMKSGDVWDNDVGDGDTWYAYGNQIINNSDNPPLCNAKGETHVELNRRQKCFVNN